MANTYTQLYVHIVFAVKGRQSLIPKRHKSELHKYITGIITNKKQTVIQINSMPDHIHILVGMAPDIAVSKLVGGYQSECVKIYQQQAMGLLADLNGKRDLVRSRAHSLPLMR